MEKFGTAGKVKKQISDRYPKEIVKIHLLGTILFTLQFLNLMSTTDLYPDYIQNIINTTEEAKAIKVNVYIMNDMVYFVKYPRLTTAGFTRNSGDFCLHIKKST